MGTQMDEFCRGITHAKKDIRKRPSRRIHFRGNPHCRFGLKTLRSAFYYKFSVFQHQCPGHAAGQIEIMGRNQGANALLRYEAKKFGMNLVGRVWVKVAGRLIGEEQQGPIGKGPGNRHSLLFAARELGWAVIEAVRKTQTDEEFPAPFHRCPAGLAGNQLRNDNVLQSIKFGEKMVELVDETDADTPHAGARLIIESATVPACDISLPLGGPFEKTGNMEQ
jgi:hypothetical protein